MKPIISPEAVRTIEGTTGMTVSKAPIAIGILVGGAVFAAMGWSMWVMKGMMASMARNMDQMSAYMKTMGAPEGYMSTMSTDMAEMRSYMRNMAGSPAQLAEYRKGHPEYAASDAASDKSGTSPCMRFHKWLVEGMSNPSFQDLHEVMVDDVHAARTANESYLASIRRDMSEMDEHMFCMYLSMSADMAAMRNAMNVMTPSFAGMGPTMGSWAEI